MNNNKAFSLLEVILAITILSTLSLITTQAISRALKARTKIQAEVDDVSALRDSMRLLKADINLAFHHRDFEKEIADLAAKAKAPAAGITPGTPPPSATAPVTKPRETKRYDPATHFVGNDSGMNFVTLNSGRLSTATLQADFIEVGYSLRECNNLTTGKPSKCLFRRTQNVIDEDVKTGGNEMVLLENVTEFKLRYIADTKQDWVSEWNSTAASQDGGSKGRFPEAVEVSMTIEREIEEKARSYSMQLVVPVHFPNNPASRPGGTGNEVNTGTSAPGGSLDQ